MFKALLKLIFLWLVLNDDILTWDNLWKKALEGSRPLPTLQRKFWKCKTSLRSIPFHQGNLDCGQINLWWERDLGRCICLRSPGRLAKGPRDKQDQALSPCFCFMDILARVKWSSFSGYSVLPTRLFLRSQTSVLQLRGIKKEEQTEKDWSPRYRFFHLFWLLWQYSK